MIFDPAFPTSLSGITVASAYLGNLSSWIPLEVGQSLNLSMSSNLFSAGGPGAGLTLDSGAVAIIDNGNLADSWNLDQAASVSVTGAMTLANSTFTAGLGVLQVNGDSTVSGNFTLSGGAIGLGASGSISLEIDGGNLSIGNATSPNTVSIDQVTLHSYGQLTVYGNAASEIGSFNQVGRDAPSMFDSFGSTYGVNIDTLSVDGTLVVDGTPDADGNHGSGIQVVQLTDNPSSTIEIDAGTVTLGGSTDFTFSGTLTGAGALRKIGTDTLVLSGVTPNALTGTSTVAAGILALDKLPAVSAIGPLTVTGGEVLLQSDDQIPFTASVTLSGTGSIDTGSFGDALANVTLNGSGAFDMSAAPSATVLGESDVVLFGDLRLNPAAAFDIGFGSGALLEAPIQVGGDVHLDGATLSATFAAGFVPVPGDSYRIIDNSSADPVDGTFNGLPEGSTVTIGGSMFRLSYAGGDGNDVVLTAGAVAMYWTGSVSNNWSDPNNWSMTPDGLTIPTHAAGPDNTAYFDAGSGTKSINIDPSQVVGGIDVRGQVTLSGSLTSIHGGDIESGAMLVMPGSLTIGDAGTLAIESGANMSFALGQDLDIGKGTLNSAGTIHGAVQAEGGLVHLSSGSIVGNVTIGSVDDLIENGGTGSFGAPETGGSLNGSGSIQGDVAVTNGDVDLSGTIHGDMSLDEGTWSGVGTVTGNVLASGSVRILAGATLSAAQLSTELTGLEIDGTVFAAVTISGGELDFGSDGAIVGSLAIDGANWNGAGTVTGSVQSTGIVAIGPVADFDVTGSLAIASGTLRIPQGAELSASSTTVVGALLGGGELASSVTLSGGVVELDLGGQIVGTLTTQSAGGTWSGLGTVSSVTISNGVFSLDSGALLSTSGLTVNAGGTLAGSGEVDSSVVSNGGIIDMDQGGDISGALTIGSAGSAWNGLGTISSGVANGLLSLGSDGTLTVLGGLTLNAGLSGGGGIAGDVTWVAGAIGLTAGAIDGTLHIDGSDDQWTGSGTVSEIDTTTHSSGVFNLTIADLSTLTVSGTLEM